MPTQGEVRYGIQELYLYPYYQTREDYKKATGVEPPKFDGTKPPKCWADPEAKSSLRRNITYERVVAYAGNGSPLVDADGRPMTEALVLNKDEAATLNIAPRGLGASNIEGSERPEVPPPLRTLRDDEELFFPFPGIVAVRVKGTLEPDRGFTEEDRSMLLAIARKLGV